MTAEREPVLLAVNNGYERRYFFSARQAATGLGWLTDTGEVQVYRLDIEATDRINTEIRQVLASPPPLHDLHNGKWLPPVRAKFQTLIRNFTGIKEA